MSHGIQMLWMIMHFVDQSLPQIDIAFIEAWLWPGDVTHVRDKLTTADLQDCSLGAPNTHV